MAVICYRLSSAFSLVNDNENLMELNEYRKMFKKSGDLITHVSTQRNNKSGIYSIYNVNNYDYGVLITKFFVDGDKPIDSLVNIIEEDLVPRHDYGQGSIFKTDFFYTYNASDKVNNLNLALSKMEDSFIQKKNDSILFLSIPLNDDISISVDNENHSFIYVHKKFLSPKENFDLCFIKVENQLYLISLKIINKTSKDDEKFKLSDLLNM